MSGIKIKMAMKMYENMRSKLSLGLDIESISTGNLYYKKKKNNDDNK